MRSISLLALLLAACAAPNVVRINHQRGIDGAWHIGENEKLVHLDATGDVLTIRFRGRTIVFTQMTRFRGFISPDEVAIEGDDTSVRLTEDEMRIVSGGETFVRPLAKLPTGRKIVYVAGGLFFE